MWVLWVFKLILLSKISPLLRIKSQPNNFGGNVGRLNNNQATGSTFQIDFVSCGNTFNSSNTAASIGGKQKKFTF